MHLRTLITASQLFNDFYKLIAILITLALMYSIIENQRTSLKMFFNSVLNTKSSNSKAQYLSALFYAFLVIALVLSYFDICCIDIGLFWTESYFLRIPAPYLICLGCSALLFFYPVYLPSFLLSVIGVLIITHANPTWSYFTLPAITAWYYIGKIGHKRLQHFLNTA